MGDLESSYVLGVLNLIGGVLVSLVVWGGAIRTLVAIFLILLMFLISTFNFISLDISLLIRMVYLSGLGVIFIYLSRVDLWAS